MYCNRTRLGTSLRGISQVSGLSYNTGVSLIRAAIEEGRRQKAYVLKILRNFCGRSTPPQIIPYQLGIQTPIDAGATEVLLGGGLKPLLPIGSA